jgi:hypothetical protein
MKLFLNIGKLQIFFKSIAPEPILTLDEPPAPTQQDSLLVVLTP